MSFYDIYDGHKVSQKCLDLTVADKYKIFSFHLRENKKKEISYSPDLYFPL